jgi:tetratricopeptide (TPR) repeat protein
LVNPVPGGIPTLLSGGARAKLAFEQAAIAVRAGDLLEAKQRVRELLLEQPGNAKALAWLAEMALNDQRSEDATILLRQAASADPAIDRQLSLIKHLHAVAGPVAALAEIERLPGSVRQDVSVRSWEALLLGMVGEHARQIALWQALTNEFPDCAALWISLGNALSTSGRSIDAVTAVRRAIDVQPTCAEAYWTLANFKSFRFAARDIAAMRKALGGKLTRAEKVHFNFALGKAFEDRRQFARSFRHYSAANELHCADLRPEHVRVTGFVDLCIETFSRELFDRPCATGCTERGPIFVIGLHRSGSTVIEQILASHPMIEGTSELPVMQQLWRSISQAAVRSACSPFAYIARLNSAALADLGAEYIERSRAYRLTDRPLFVDKLPANWLHVGLIRLVLPNARIIDARRHPLACGFSNFKQHYATGVAFAYSLASIGCFYRDYLRLMQHFDRVQPGAIHHVLNEQLISDKQSEIRRLLDHVGVPWDSACLTPHTNQRAVRTPSAEQVRRPISSEGMNAWRHYELWLGPLKVALGPALDDWIPATVEGGTRGGLRLCFD